MRKVFSFSLKIEQGKVDKNDQDSAVILGFDEVQADLMDEAPSRFPKKTTKRQPIENLAGLKDAIPYLCWSDAQAADAYVRKLARGEEFDSKQYEYCRTLMTRACLRRWNKEGKWW